MTPDLFTYAADTARDQAHVRKLGKAGFYQTTPLSPAEKLKARQAAGRQERTVLDMIRRHGPMSPSEVLATYPNDHVPLTSLRRAMTSLSNKGLLVKTDRLVAGGWGKPEHVWEAV